MIADTIADLVKTRGRSDFWLLDSDVKLLKSEYLFPR